MSIRTKLILSYIAMTLIPVIIILIIMRLMFPLFIKDAQNFVPGSTRFFVGLTVDDQRQQELHSLFSQTASLRPELFSDPAFLVTLEKELEKQTFKTWMVVRKQDRIIYSSPGFSSVYRKRLPDFGSQTQHKKITLGEKDFTLSQYDFNLEPHVPGSVFTLSDLTPLSRITVTLATLFIVITVVVVMITNGLLTFFISRSIIKPLLSLKNSTEKIKAGDLDFSITYAKKNELGQLAAAFESMRSQLKASLEKQAQYEANRKELITGISHDLKTPLTALKGYVEGIIDGVANTPEKMKHYIHTIRIKANQLDRLTDELFLFSKMDLHKIPFHFQTINLTDFLQDLLDELRFDLEEKKIELHYYNDAPYSLPVKADGEKLRRVVMNIIDNSLKHLAEQEEPGQITIRLSEEADKVMIRIEDNGPGIKADELPFIFDRFYRGDPARGSTDGSGLGLAIAKLIIQEHGGEIWAESEVGQGTAIGIFFKRI